MSTRAMIAVHNESDEIVGRYVHYDGYPDGLGAGLFALKKSWEDPYAMAAMLIDGAPQGYRCILDRGEDGVDIEPFDLEDDPVLLTRDHLYDLDYAYIIHATGMTIIRNQDNFLEVDWNHEPESWTALKEILRQGD